MKNMMHVAVLHATCRWVDDAQVHAACFTEINDEAALLRDAMAESLREAEEAKKKEQV